MGAPGTWPTSTPRRQQRQRLVPSELRWRRHASKPKGLPWRARREETRIQSPQKWVHCAVQKREVGGDPWCKKCLTWLDWAGGITDKFIDALRVGSSRLPGVTADAGGDDPSYLNPGLKLGFTRPAFPAAIRHGRPGGYFWHPATPRDKAGGYLSYQQNPNRGVGWYVCHQTNWRLYFFTDTNDDKTFERVSLYWTRVKRRTRKNYRNHNDFSKNEYVYIYIYILI